MSRITSLSTIIFVLLPTVGSTFSEADPGYFNYDPTGPHGPSKWKYIDEIEAGDPGMFWHTFNLTDGSDVTNECGSSKKQSPIDVCDAPSDTCTESHEMRPKSGDYEMDSDLIQKQILPNKLRLIMTRRTGDEPDPPQIDFSSTGQGIIDMTNIDFKFPSEHTVCGQEFDGEMQYFVYNSERNRFLAVSFFLDGENVVFYFLALHSTTYMRRQHSEFFLMINDFHQCIVASETNPKNEHLQEVIDAFMLVYKEDRRKCKRRQRLSSSNTAARDFASGSGRMMHNVDGDGVDSHFSLYGEEQYGIPLNLTIIEDTTVGGLRSQRRRLAFAWHPFHPDVQKSIHFW